MRPPSLSTWLLGSVFLANILLSQPCLAESWIYTVRPKDTLWDLCIKYTNNPECWHDLAEVNHITNPKVLPPGTRLKMPIEWLKLKPAQAKLLAITGVVVFKNESDKAWKRAKKHQTFSIGQQLRTKQGSATIEFADGSLLYLLPDSEITFDLLSAYEESGKVDTRVRLEKGRTRHKVKPLRDNDSRYEITSPAAVAAVRGTEYRVSYSNSTMRASVLEGHVAIAAQDSETLVDQGMGTSVKKGEKPLPPTTLLEAPVLKQRDIKTKDQAVTVSWQALSDAKGYEWRQFVAEDEKWILLHQGKTQATEATVALESDSQYRFLLAGVDRHGILGKEQTLSINKTGSSRAQYCMQEDYCLGLLISIFLILGI